MLKTRNGNVVPVKDPMDGFDHLRGVLAPHVHRLDQYSYRPVGGSAGWSVCVNGPFSAACNNTLRIYPRPRPAAPLVASTLDEGQR